MPVLNQPGHWDFFISHTQRNPNAVILASELYYALRERNSSCWLDVRMDELNTAAMEEGVRNSKVVLAVISDGAGVEGNGYLERPMCVNELRWAKDSGKLIQPVIRAEDKKRIGELMEKAPKDMQFLWNTNFIHLDRSDKDFWETGLEKLEKVFRKVAQTNTGTSRGNNGSSSREKKKSAPAPVEIVEFLEDLKLEQYAGALCEQGVQTLDDLKEVDEHLLGDIGCTRVEMNRFLRKRPTTAMPATRRPRFDVDALKSSGDIHGLVQAVTVGKEDTKTQAARALASLAVDPENQKRIAEAGGIVPLVALVKTGNAEGKTKAADALYNLTANNAELTKQVEAMGYTRAQLDHLGS